MAAVDGQVKLAMEIRHRPGLIFFFNFAVDDEEKIDRLPACNQTWRT